ncbi:MAG TPA: glycoside hydrolase family 3 protein [Terriglobales bacterium]|nr:glycoside hydrolase family 3 protein [Terriglobales bacterium]
MFSILWIAPFHFPQYALALPMLRTPTLLVALFTLLGSAALTREKYQESSGPRRQGAAENWAEHTLLTLSLEEKVGQLFMIRLRVESLYGDSPAYLQVRSRVRRYHIGSLALSVPADARFRHGNDRYETVRLLNRLQAAAKLPLLIAGDFERGVLPPSLFGTTVFPHAMAFGAAGNPAYAEEFGRITAEESRALGVHWNLFPVADVNTNPANPIIGTRAFGENPRQVADLVAAYIRGAQAYRMLTTAKHFPGHGNTGADSHLAVASVNEDLQFLSAVDLPPFRKAIAAGVDAVMTAHIRVPALDPDPNHVATTSPQIITGLLRHQLGFKGMIVTDALDMAGLSSLYAANSGRAAVDAFKAGNDVLTMPDDLEASYRALLAAVRTGEISRERLDASVLKILRAKASLGLERTRLVDLGAIPRLVGNPENIAVGQRISDASITLVRDNGILLPLRAKPRSSSAVILAPRVQPTPHTVLVILCDHLRADDGRVLERQIRDRLPDAGAIYVDPRVASTRSDVVLKAVDQAQEVIVAVYVVPSAARTRSVARGQKNSASLPDSTGRLLDRILARAADKTAVLAMGNPYLTEDFPAIQNYICTFSNATVSEISAAKALFGEIPISGHLPVNLDNASGRVAGNQRPAQPANMASPYWHFPAEDWLFGLMQSP